MLHDLCCSMLEELQRYKHSPEDRLIYYMNERLDKSLTTYYEELSDSIEYLTRRKDPTAVVKRMFK